MNSQVALALALLCYQSVQCYQSDVVEFCTNVLRTVDESAGESCRCPGVQGKRGPNWFPGPKGQKGSQGEQGTCNDLQQKMTRLELTLEKIVKTPEVALHYCSMGMKSRSIPDSSIATSTDHNPEHAGRFGRLDEPVRGGSVGAWCPLTSTLGEWIQVDLGTPLTVAGVVTQGRIGKSNSWWVTTFKVSCGNTTEHMPVIKDHGATKIFVGNTDADSKIINWFPETLSCRYVRVYALSWHTFLCMRMELLSGDCMGI